MMKTCLHGKTETSCPQCAAFRLNAKINGRLKSCQHCQLLPDCDWPDGYNCKRFIPKKKATAIEDVLEERRRQVDSLGWDAAHDDSEHLEGDLALAAACYSINASCYDHRGQSSISSCISFIKEFWPWDIKWWKPKDPRRDLVRAAALIIAEIERMDREVTND